MSEGISGAHMSTSGAHAPPERPAGSWVAGLTVFAGVMMMMAGIFGAVAGFAALLEDKFYVLGREYVFEFDVTTWGWLHLLVGITIAVAGFFVFSGQPWARGVGIVCAVLNALVNFMFIPYYPVWSMLIIALDVMVIWALATYSKSDADVYWAR